MSRASGVGRARAREVALQALHALDVQGSRDAEAALDALERHFELPSAAREFARTLVVGVVARRGVLDERIDATARNWRLERMAVVDRNVLRLGGFELLYTDTPREVVIDEAVALAHRFGGDASPGFVNGVLDALAHDGGGAVAAGGKPG